MDNNEVVTEEVAAVVENNTGIEIEPLFEETVDFDTLEDNTVTVRDRDTMQQERVKISDLKAYFEDKFTF